MKSFVVSALVLCSAISIDAGVFFRRTGRTSEPLSSYVVGQFGASSSVDQISSPFIGSDSSFGGSAADAGSVESAPIAPVIAILSETNNAPGTLGDNSDFDNAFEAKNGIKQEAVGSTVVLNEDSVVIMTGSYEYVGEDGQTYVVDWVADENGFQPSAAHLPKEVPIPFPEIAEAVAAQIAFAAQEDAAGESAAAGSDEELVDSSAAAGEFQQSFGASGQSQSVALLSKYGQ
ncbi:uncharacterized protein [Lepeophtheirus salmonis]|uniref:uncharacterized protein n=1 Tax=Lepeophtheirus salmonis TaxID=72036 RepID=UPI001AE8BCE8|nr:pupal cuticle protein 27-like [Lepeophtheirus salmonis]